jgi:hypothetical protein
MTGERWTIPSLHDHLVALLDEHDKRYMERFTAQEKAMIVALQAIDRRLEGMNELRSSLSYLSARQITREAADLRFSSLDTKIDDLKEYINQTKGRSSGSSAAWATLVSVVAMIGSIVAIVTALTR